MSYKIHPSMRAEYKALVEELKLARSQKLLDDTKNEVLELAIFKALPQVCVHCGTTQHLTLDHIVPEYLLKDLDVQEVIEDNYQVLCKYCNGKKSHRLDMREPKVKEILKRIIINL